MVDLPVHRAPFILPTPEANRMSDGQVDFYVPSTPGKRAAVIFVHGMPYSADTLPSPRSWPVYIGYGAQVAARGMVGAVCDHSPDGAADYERSAATIEEIVEQVRRHPGVDADRIGLWFFSGGGPLCTPYLRQPPKWLRCVSLTYPCLQGVGGPLPERFRAAGALAYAAEVPLVLSAAGRERPESAAAVEDFVAAAREAAVEIDVKTAVEGVHGFDFRQHDHASRQIVVDGLDAVAARLRA